MGGLVLEEALRVAPRLPRVYPPHYPRYRRTRTHHTHCTRYERNDARFGFGAARCTT